MLNPQEWISRGEVGVGVGNGPSCGLGQGPRFLPKEPFQGLPSTAHRKLQPGRLARVPLSIPTGRFEIGCCDTRVMARFL